MFNDTFYPTPPELAKRMAAKVKGYPAKILEPSAGKGDIADFLKEHFGQYRRAEVECIEVDETLQATLRGKGYKVLDADFLQYSGPDKFDLIVANPPFDNGDKHLLKAIDILYRGQIVFLLNAETLKNPCTNTRKLLARKLSELGAEIEYIQGAFKDAERKTGVEVALVNIVVERCVEDDLFQGCDDHAARAYERVQDQHELSTGQNVVELVAEYNKTVDIGQQTILGYFKNYKQVSPFIGLNREAGHRDFAGKDLTEKMQTKLNDFLSSVRTSFWRKSLELKEVKSRLTSKKQQEFEEAIKERCHMDFTESNVRQFVLNLVGSYEQTLTEAVIDLFDMFTRRHCYTETIHEKNIHYFNGWKTNNAFKVGKRIVVPIGNSYGNMAFFDYNGWKLDYQAAQKLDDIDKVMNYFDGRSEYVSLADACKKAFGEDINWGCSTYFKFKAHKKGTIHLTFLNEGILRRFNICACRGKGWLPEDYGAKPYKEMTFEERSVVNAFDGEKTYSSNLNRPLFAPSNRLQISLNVEDSCLQKPA